MTDPSRRRMLAVAYGPPSMAQACDGLPRIRERADCVELRLDLFQEPFDLPLLLRERGDVPAVVTLRPPNQGGRSPLRAEERLKILLKAAELGAEYADIEYDVASPSAVAALRAAGALVIVSRHDFLRMPSDLADGWWPSLAALDADVVKVVGTAVDVRDCLNVLRTFERADRPTIAMAMGVPGLASRVLALRSEQCLLSYAALEAGSGTAPGQLTLDEMRSTYRVERLGSGTRVYGLLGPHLERDRLSEYNAWFASDGFDAVAVPFVADVDADGIVSAFRELPVAGWHIHGAELQREVLSALDEMPSDGRANAIVRRADGALIGAWVESPREQYDLWRSAVVS